MRIRKKNILLQLQNPTSATQRVNIFNQFLQSGGEQVQPVYAAWDMTAALASSIANNCTLLFLTYQYTSTGSYYIPAASLASGIFDSIDKIVSALNSLPLLPLGSKVLFYNNGNTVICQSNGFFFSSITLSPQPEWGIQTSVESDYSVNGSLLYNPGFNVNGTGNFTRISLTNPLWTNIPADTASGPGNRCSNWNAFIPSGLYYGCINSYTITKQAYIGLCANSKADIVVNNKQILLQNGAAMDAYISTALSGTFTKTPYTFFNIYPIPYVIGNNIIQCSNINDGSALPPYYGALGFEIYDNTAAEIAAATSLSDLTVATQTNAALTSFILMGN